MGENPFDGPYGKKKTEYERYLQTETLLGLQKPPAERSHPDELLFQSIHQVEELWFKVIIHEVGEALLRLDEDDHAGATAHLSRATQIQHLVVQQLHLFDTMQPGAYLVIRAGLGQGSGLDSPGFNRCNEVAPKLWEAYERALSRAGLELLAVYTAPFPHTALLQVAEAMVTFDAQMQRFKLEHIMTVKRIIGIGTASLRGNPIDMLERSARLTYFPMLWAVRDRMFIDFRAGPEIK